MINGERSEGRERKAAKEEMYDGKSRPVYNDIRM